MSNIQAVRQHSLDTLREKIAPKAGPDDLRYLGAVAQHLGLDPIAGHIVLIPRWDSRLGREIHRPQVTTEGRLVLAERTGQLEGFDGPVWCGPSDSKAGRPPVWVEVWDDDDPPHAARVLVYRRGWRPINGTVRWAEFAQRDRGGKLLALWDQMKAHMLGKTALNLALRRGFPGIIPTDADLDDDFPDIETPQAVDGPAVDPFAPRDRPAVDVTARQSMLQAAEGLRIADPPAAVWLIREADYYGLPKLSGGEAMSRAEGELWRRLLADAPFAVGGARPEMSAEAWGAPVPDDVHDDQPESTGSVDADQATSYDPDSP